MVGNLRIVCAFVNIAMNGFGAAFFGVVIESLIDAKVKATLASLPKSPAPSSKIE